MRYRAGLWGPMTLVLGLVFSPVFGVLVVLALTSGTGGWGVVASCVAVAALAVGVGGILCGISSLRYVRLVTAPDGRTALSVPVFSVRRGLGREVVPADDVVGVRLDYLAAVHNSRWRLRVSAAGGRVIVSDSITAGTGPRGRVDDTRGGRAVTAIRHQLRAAQHSG